VRYLRLYRRGLGAHIRAVLEYQSDFWLLVVAGLITQSLGLVFLSAVFAKVPTLNGWRFEEMVLVYGMAGLSQGVVPLIADGIWSVGNQIHTGELDYRLVRPYPVILQLMSNQVGFNGLGDTLGSGALFGWALVHVRVHWTVATTVTGLVLLGGAIIVRIAITVASNAVSFWLRAPFPMFAGAMFQVGELARYPISIYGLTIRVLIAGIVPFGFASFFPASWVLHKGGYAWLGLATPVVAAGYAWFAYALFRRGLRRYESTGH
jgi:ABC-2 type transport system permease protein